MVDERQADSKSENVSKLDVDSQGYWKCFLKYEGYQAIQHGRQNYLDLQRKRQI